MTSSSSAASSAKGASAPLVIALCFVVAMIEGFDIQAAGVVAPRLRPALGLSPDQMGLFFSSATLGLILGALVGGRLADRFGRKAALLPSLALFGLFSLVTAAAHNFEMLFWARLITGIGIGGAMPSLIAIVAENAKPGRTAAAVAALYAGMPAGGAIASLLAALTADHGWQTVFLVGGAIPLLLVPVLWRLLPGGRVTAADPARKPAALQALFGRGYAANTTIMWLGFFCALLVHGLLLNWLPSLLVARGVSPAQAGVVQILFNVAGATGSLIAGRCMVAFPQRRVVALAFLGLLGALLILSQAPPTLGFILTAAFFVGLTGMGVQGIVYGLAPRFYPTETRGTGVGAAVAVGRFGSMVGPLVAPILLKAGGPTGVLIGIIPVAVVAAIATFVLVSRKDAAAIEAATPAA